VVLVLVAGVPVGAVVVVCVSVCDEVLGGVVTVTFGAGEGLSWTTVVLLGDGVVTTSGVLSTVQPMIIKLASSDTSRALTALVLFIICSPLVARMFLLALACS
jgi:hypothetical protein